MRAAAAIVASWMAIGMAGAWAQDDEILAINADDLPKLWTRTGGSDQGDLFGRIKYRAGCASVGYIVESNGTPSSIKVLRSWPDLGFGAATEDMVRSWRFEPTRGNPKRLAVYTVQLFVLTIPGAAMDTGSRIKKTIDAEAVAQQCAVESVQFGG